MKSSEENLRKHLGLEQMSTEELEDLLRREVAASEDNLDLILAIMEVIKGREVEQDPLIDEDTAWNTFLARNNLPASTEQSTETSEQTAKENGVSAPTKKRAHKKLYMGISVAVLLCLLSSIMLFTAVGSNGNQDDVNWSEHLFSFGKKEPSFAALDDASFKQAQDAVSALTDLPVLPAKYPAGSALIQIEENSSFQMDNVVLVFSVPDGEYSISVTVEKDSQADTYTVYEKEAGSPESYYVQGIPHYIMRNTDHTVAVWRNENVECCIQGHVSIDEMKTIIDSIYE